MERSAIHLLAKRGKSQRQIAEELGRNRRTVARVLREPVDRLPAKRYRRSKVDPYRAQIAAWIGQGLTAARMLELARGAWRTISTVQPSSASIHILPAPV